MRNLLLVSSSLVILTACSSVESNVVDTAGMYANFAAVAGGTGTTEVMAELLLGENSLDFVKLEGGDMLRAYMIHPVTFAETEVMMSEYLFGGATWYKASFATQETNTGFRINFDRSASGKVSAPASSTTLPVPFVLSTSPTTTTFSRSGTTAFNVYWDPYAFVTGDLLSYEVSGSCIQTSRGGINWQNGIDTLQLAQSFLLAAQGQETNTCNVTVKISLSRNGTVDRAFGKTGVFPGVQERTLSLSCTP
ncbi:MAG: hypothetical protein HY903_18500 [Deltaproteobacteria bacterium]|nr:hypothetical protein [Deltaproteobacteria bacterium]